MLKYYKIKYLEQLLKTYLFLRTWVCLPDSVTRLKKKKDWLEAPCHHGRTDCLHGEPRTRLFISGLVSRYSCLFYSSSLLGCKSLEDESCILPT